MKTKCQECNREAEIRNDSIMYVCPCGHTNEIYRELEGGKE